MTRESLVELLTAADAAAYLGVKPQTLRKWRVTGRGPAYLRFGDGEHGRVTYRMSDVQAWLAKRVVASTAQESENARSR